MKKRKLEKKLRIRYDYCKMWLTTFIAMFITTSIGFFTVQKESFRNTLGILVLVLIIIIPFFYIYFTLLYKKLLDLLD